MKERKKERKKEKKKTFIWAVASGRGGGHRNRRDELKVSYNSLVIQVMSQHAMPTLARALCRHTRTRKQRHRDAHIHTHAQRDDKNTDTHTETHACQQKHAHTRTRRHTCTQTQRHTQTTQSSIYSLLTTVAMLLPPQHLPPLSMRESERRWWMRCTARHREQHNKMRGLPLWKEREQAQERERARERESERTDQGRERESTDQEREREAERDGNSL